MEKEKEKQNVSQRQNQFEIVIFLLVGCRILILVEQNYQSINEVMKIDNQSPSQSKTQCRHKKPLYLTKYKLRTQRNEQLKVDDSFNKSGDRRGRAKTEIQSEFSQHQIKCDIDDISRKTSHQLKMLNFSHHDSHLCVCSDCTCGRHLCKLHAIKPDLRKNTTYQKEYLPKKPVKNVINISSEYSRLMGPNLELNSVYVQDFDRKPTQVMRPRPSDSLKTEGPLYNLTSYATSFPGHHGDNQYIKPTDIHVRGNFPMRCRSTYSRSFTGTPCKKNKYDRRPDNLKTGSDWYGNTTYSNTFKEPNPQYFPPKYTVTEKAEQIPAYTSHQTETSYRNNYVKHENRLCPAKTIVQIRSKGIYAKKKSKFSQKTDFKALDPNYKPLSLSKFNNI